MALISSSIRAPYSSTRAARTRPVARLAGPVALSPRGRALSTGVVAAAKTAAPVKVIIQGRRLEVTPAIKTYVEEKISRAVHNYSAGIKHIDVTLSARGGDTGTHGARQQKVDVTIYTVRAGVVRVEDAEASLYASIDTVADKVARKLTRMKELAIKKGTWPGRAGPRENSEDQEFREWMDTVIVETKAFDEDQARAAELAHLGAAASPSGIPDTILRSKVLRVDRMPVDDAIDAMEAVGHAFFLFRDSEASARPGRSEAGPRVLPHERAAALASAAPSRRNNLPMVPLTTASKTSDDFESQISQSGEVNVVYKRSAGGYGVLIPEAK
ncbi:30S ribosomal protein 1 [Monoraphidium neglectum]|uniref:30S ribosomal protein 1 n=1 Tax=Monoraphidium neglectum TaxID=145388 RepID=A0A0D2MCY5_9CHLO|nr:30S ribosomal protein 1 [Monoraphidium neglectum]KIZ01060.1 30S ribosomal protein 1 [Monoraphidium neglectum]|eukprot:XP_013900079.1 30S ribosomal protein 1 [Monoraphidium neglectum]